VSDVTARLTRPREARGEGQLTAVSLFAGIEGFGLALERCGVNVTVSVEIDAECRGVIGRHFPGAKLFDDVRKVTANDLRAAGFVPARGILTGGFPCQDLSIAGRRAGLGGARSGLFWEIVRLADELSPRWLILENVPGLLSAVCSCPGDETCMDNGRAVRCGEYRTVPGESDAHERRRWFAHVPHTPKGGACPGGCMELHGGAMGTVLGALGNIGYGFAYRVLDAQFFGVPQRRERVFIVGCLGDWAAPVEILLDPEGCERNPAARGQAGADVAGTLGSRAGGSRTTDLDGHGAYIAATLQAGSNGRGHRIDAEGAAGGHLIPMAYAVQDCRFMDKAMNGLGVSGDGAPSYTLDTTGVQSVAYTLRSEGHDASDDGPGRQTLIPVAATLTSGAHSHGVSDPGRRSEDDVNLVAEPMAFNPQTGGNFRLGYGHKPTALSCTQTTGVAFSENQRGELVETPTAHQLTTGGGKPGQGYPAVRTATAVRRLTPLERERLQGFPDDWTRWRLDASGNEVEQSDSARDRQTGNAVAVPVVEWIASRLVAADLARGSEAGAA
jgi:DNA (cytosine-5)-methyltransferase 1